MQPEELCVRGNGGQLSNRMGRVTIMKEEGVFDCRKSLHSRINAELTLKVCTATTLWPGTS
jgi:hypothetical protein